jgi:GWxTD domain-containing protein
MSWFLRLLSCLVVFAGQAISQRIEPSGSFVLNFDYARFRNDSATCYLELYYGFYPKLLTYDFSDGRFHGGVKLWTVLRNTATSVPVINEAVLLPFTAKDTSAESFRYTFVTQGGYAVPFGDYIVEITAADSLNPSRRDSLRLTLEARQSPAGIAVSDLELCSTIKESQQRSDAFYKNSLEVVPNPTLVFGVTSNPIVFNYAEVYNLDPDRTYTVKTQVIDAAKKTVRESSKTRKYGIKSAVEVGTTNITSLQSGRYQFRLAFFEGEREVASSVKTFFVYNPHIQAASVSNVSAKAHELAGLSNEELADEFRKSKYMATDQEIQMFGQISNPDGRREFLAKFWNEVEEGKQGRQPIRRIDYLRRVNAANQRFRTMSKDGWLTDRGRVFILYGEPDEIQRFPSSEENKPYEIWRFYQVENGVQFVFVDRTGFGDYALVHSTARGELRDDAWERFLR